MVITNVFDAEKQPVTAHHGQGTIDFVRPFSASDFQSPLNFIDYVEIPPGHSIGYHPHSNNEEIYFIVAGSGLMTVNSTSQHVRAGDIIVNKVDWSHGIENNSDGVLKILVWEIRV